MPNRSLFRMLLASLTVLAVACSFDMTAKVDIEQRGHESSDTTGGTNANAASSSSSTATSSSSNSTGGSQPATTTSNGANNAGQVQNTSNTGGPITTTSTSTTTTTTTGANNGAANNGATNNGTANDTTSAAHWFPSTFFLNQAVDTAAVDSQSSAIVSALQSRGGFGAGAFKIDFSIDVYYTDAATVNLPFQDEGVYQPDSDIPTSVPVAPNGSAIGFESSFGTTCDSGDCHYLVVDRTNKKLIEVDEAQVESGKFQSFGSVAIWDFLHTYGPELRGDVCTSADAGGFPMAPMLFSAEEVAAGTINHAIRLILPNNRIQCRTYVRPASHTTGPSNCSGWATTNGVPYGARFRLKSSYNLQSLPNAGARVVAKALQQYGMILADGGNIALTAKSDKFSTTKWDGLLGSNDLNALQVTDFEMVDGGTRLHPSSIDCTRAP